MAEFPPDDPASRAAQAKIIEAGLKTEKQIKTGTLPSNVRAYQGGGTSIGERAQAISEAEQRLKALETKRKEDERIRQRENIRIDREMREKINAAQQRNRETLSTTAGIQGRQQRQIELAQEISRIQNEARLDKLQAGIVESVTVGGVTVTSPAQAALIRKATTSGVTEEEARGLPQEFREQLVFPKQQVVDTNKIARTEYFLSTGKTTGATPSGRGTVTFETPTPETFTKFDTTQKKQQVVFDFISGKTFEENVLAKSPSYKPRDLKAEKQFFEEKTGLPIFTAAKGAGLGTVRASEFITGRKIPEPFRTATAETIGNLYLFSYFSIAMKNAATKKTKQKLEQVQKKTSGYTEKDFETIEDSIRQNFNAGRVQEIREAYRAALATGNKDTVSVVEKMLRNALGKKEAATIIKDIRLQEGIITFKTPSLPKSPTTPTTTITTPAPVELEQLPIVTGSIYAGTGLYEKGKPTDNVLGLGSIPRSIFEEDLRPSGTIDLTKESTGLFEGYGQEETMFKDTQPSAQAPTTFVSPFQQQFIDTQELQAEQSMLRQQEQLRQAQQNMLQQKSGQSSILRSALVSAQSLQQQQQLRQQQQLKLKLQLKLQQPTAQIQPPTTKLKLGIRIPKLSGGVTKKTRVLTSAIKKVKFKVWERRKGQWKPFAEAPTKVEAKLKGIERVRRTLGASFKVTKEGKPVNLKVSSPVFRPAKKEPFVYVQKRKFRLSTGSEVSEIQKAKKKGGRKLKWL